MDDIRNDNVKIRTAGDIAHYGNNALSILSVDIPHLRLILERRDVIDDQLNRILQRIVTATEKATSTINKAHKYAEHLENGEPQDRREIF